MSLIFIGPAGACEFPWIHYALLCDNMNHHFKAQDFASRFRELQRAGGALGGHRVTASALGLREEVAFARALCLLPGDKLAISGHTKAVLFMQPVPPREGSTEIIKSRLDIPWVTEKPRTLGDVFGSLVAGLLEITNGASETDAVQIIDG